MEYKQLNTIPKELANIPSPPKQLYAAGQNLKNLLNKPRLAIVGSRKVTPYGIQVTADLASKLSGQGLVIISGLALGVDGIAHQGALDGGKLTIAVLPSSLDLITPTSHYYLAKSIVAQGGALISEYDPGTPALKQHFIARNRLIAGLADAVLITEAAVDSGSLYTANFAREQGKPVLVVPGNITNPMSAGTNALLKEGAHAVTNYQDVIKLMGLTPHKLKASEICGDTPDEQLLLELLLNGHSETDELEQLSQLEVSEFNRIMTGLELKNKVRRVGHDKWGIF